MEIQKTPKWIKAIIVIEVLLAVTAPKWIEVFSYA
jgi:hypothetical protein